MNFRIEGEDDGLSGFCNPPGRAREGGTAVIRVGAVSARAHPGGPGRGIPRRLPKTLHELAARLPCRRRNKERSHGVQALCTAAERTDGPGCPAGGRRVHGHCELSYLRIMGCRGLGSSRRTLDGRTLRSGDPREESTTGRGAGSGAAAAHLRGCPGSGDGSRGVGGGHYVLRRSGGR